MLLTITDLAGTDGTITVDESNVVPAIRGWYPNPTVEIRNALNELDCALPFYPDEPTDSLEQFLGIRITRCLTVTTTVTWDQIYAAQYGVDAVPNRCLVVVTCPTGYDAATITAEDIVHDDAIQIVFRD